MATIPTTATTTHGSSATLLRRAMLGNAAFSTLSGLAFCVAATPIAAYLGAAPARLVFATGIGLFVFAAGLVINARRPRIKLAEAKMAIVGDFAWVAGSIAAVAFKDTIGLTHGGAWAVMLVADMVLVFGVLQFVGLRRIQHAGSA